MNKKCIQSTNVFGFPLQNPCDDVRLHVTDSRDADNFCIARKISCKHHVPLEDPAAEPTPSFWLVWRDGHNSTPHRKHDSEHSARNEAERLARLHPGDRFYVLAAGQFATCDIQPVAWRDGDLSEEMPF